MRKIIVIIFCFISSIVSAQEYYVQSILELTNDLTARRKSVIDSNGKGCALVRISIPSVNNIEFKSSYNNSSNPLLFADNLYLGDEEIKDLVIPEA